MSASTVFQFLAFFISIALLFKNGETATICYSCGGLTNPHNCDKTVECSSGEQCYTRAYISDILSVLYDLGCTSNEFCSVVNKRGIQTWTHDSLMTNITDISYPLPDRQTDEKHSRRKRQYEVPLCTGCCDKEHCNDDLCPSSLISKPTGTKCYDCGSTLLEDPADCNTVRICGADQKCHVTERTYPTGRKFLVNCKSKAYCDVLGNNAVFGKRDTYLCHACCDTDNCNIDYCSRKRPLPGGTTSSPITTTTKVTTTAGPTNAPTLTLINVQGPQDSVREANTVPNSFYCQVNGLPAPTYSWTFTSTNGTTISLDSKATMTGVTSVLIIDPVNPEDEGNYTCVADNGRESTRQSGFLTVYTKLKMLAKPFTDLSLLEGSGAVLYCGFEGYPTPTYTWTFNDSNGQVTDLTSMATADQTTIVLKNVDRNQTGLYKCVADNGYDRQSQESKLVVTYPPEFLTSVPDDVVNVTAGDNFTIQCQAEGVPTPTYSFQFVDESLIPIILQNVAIDTIKGTLFIPKVDLTYSGTYTCYARNTEGASSQATKVKVIT